MTGTSLTYNGYPVAKTTMEGHSSAASRVLDVPELLSAILLPLQLYDPGEAKHLLACAQVNSLWEHQAGRLLWENCGGRSSYIGPWHPTLKDLVSITPNRRQKYANHVRHLRIVDEEDEHDDFGIWWSAPCLSQIGDVSFPRLEFLEIETSGSEEEVESFEAAILTKLAQPNLKSLVLICAGELCELIKEDFLTCLEKNCKNLEDIDCDMEVVGVSTERWASFLLSLPSIKRVHSTWNDVMSLEAFQALSRLRRLESLTLGQIKDSWVDVVRTSADGSTFRSLVGLDCGISAHGAEGMLPWLHKLHKLRMSECSKRPGLFRSLLSAKFSCLDSLILHLHKDTVIDSKEFLAMLSHGARLRTLILTVGRDDTLGTRTLQMDPLDEGIFEAIAKQQPALERLEFECKSKDSSLGANSMRSLGLYCPNLKHLMISAIIDWAELVEIAPPNGWPSLSWLMFLDSPMDREVARMDDDVVRNVLQLMPSLGLERSGLCRVE